MQRPDRPSPQLGAILYGHGSGIEPLMVEVVRTLRREGVHVGGLVEHTIRPAGDAGCSSLELEDLVSGTRYRLTQNLGTGSRACALDSTALAEASRALRDAVADRMDVVVVNKFGAQEAAGKGLRSEMLQIVSSGIPLLTAVSRRFLPQWRQFAGCEAILLPAALSGVLEWWRHLHGPMPAVRSRTRSHGTAPHW